MIANNSFNMSNPANEEEDTDPIGFHAPVQKRERTRRMAALQNDQPANNKRPNVSHP